MCSRLEQLAYRDTKRAGETDQCHSSGLYPSALDKTEVLGSEARSFGDDVLREVEFET